MFRCELFSRGHFNGEQRLLTHFQEEGLAADLHCRDMWNGQTCLFLLSFCAVTQTLLSFSLVSGPTGKWGLQPNVSESVGVTWKHHFFTWMRCTGLFSFPGRRTPPFSHVSWKQTLWLLLLFNYCIVFRCIKWLMSDDSQLCGWVMNYSAYFVRPLSAFSLLLVQNYTGGKLWNDGPRKIQHYQMRINYYYH